jgi:hypothetical protein
MDLAIPTGHYVAPLPQQPTTKQHLALRARQVMMMMMLMMMKMGIQVLVLRRLPPSGENNGNNSNSKTTIYRKKYALDELPK